MRTDLSGDLDFINEVMRGEAQADTAVRDSEGLLPVAGPVAGSSRFADEVQAIVDRYGRLEDMRARLGLSRRQICARLLVDASAWSRWTHGGTDSAPPHVYRTLGLLLEKLVAAPAVPEKPVFDPVLREEFVEPRRPEFRDLAAQFEILRLQVEKLEAQSAKREILSFGWKLMVLLNAAAVLYFVLS